jgi:hypothetical protein
LDFHIVDNLPQTLINYNFVRANHLFQ